jgi:polyribonucleotide nucleotidyltransferase
MLVGSNYKKIKQIQEKYKCNIKITDDDNEQVKITIVGNDKSTVEMLEKKLNVKKREYNMDKRLVSFLIGQKGDRIKTIIENSQLIKIDFDNAVSNSGERICLL